MSAKREESVCAFRACGAHCKASRLRSYGAFTASANLKEFRNLLAASS